jgi:hypothetical protein
MMRQVPHLDGSWDDTFGVIAPCPNRRDIRIVPSAVTSDDDGSVH